MLDLLLIMALGFLGSFGHCVGMCSPIAVAFSLNNSANHHNWQQQLRFHLLLNLGRLASYTLVGAGIGTLGSVLVAGGQLAGIGGSFRRGMAIFTGLLLIWLALGQLQPNFLPRLPLLFSATKNIHTSLNSFFDYLSRHFQWWTPLALGSVWGLIPCGFLYAAQIKAAETVSPWGGAATMAAFGVGTMPSMVAVGVASARLSQDRRSQLFRLGSWLTLAIGILLLLRNDDMVDYTGHGALLLLMMALVARPLSKFWSQPLKYRRAIGVGSYILALVHTAHMIDHTFRWNLDAFNFMLPIHQGAIACGAAALLAMTPAALTSFDSLQNRLGRSWRFLHLLTIPALILATIHTIFIGSHYWGSLQVTPQQQMQVIGLVTLVILIWGWRILSYKLLK